jgi:hypothetical protein
MKQYAHNACGTIALFHVIVNCLEDYPDAVKNASFFSEFRAKVEKKSPEERGQIFKSSNEILQ